MKKILALLLTAALLLGVCSAFAEDAEDSKYDKLTVGTGTVFSGNFLADALGSNISDQDVRRLIHGYSLVRWDSATGSYQFSRPPVTAVTVSGDELTFTFAISQDLKYSDGTPITARDYAFTLLLLGSWELKDAAGNREDISRIAGGSAYMNRSAKELSGFRILGDYQFSLELDAAYTPYFYQLKALDVMPLPISVLAPDCEVKDDGAGAYISGTFTADVLKETILDPETGYMNHPSVSCGPYMLTDYDGNNVTLALNPEYAGDETGVKPTIPQIIVKSDSSGTLIEQLSAGDIDLAVRTAQAKQIAAGMQLMSGGDIAMKAYSRAGLAFISFCAEKGPTADVTVRQALAMCMDKEQLTSSYLGAFGTTVKGYYGIGQWMFMMANGTLVPAEGEEEAWADLTLDNIPEYPLDPEAAARLLEQDGWVLNAAGGTFHAETDNLRYKLIDDELVPLSLKLIYPEGNGAEPLLEESFIANLDAIGIQLETEAMPMPELLKLYYGQEERNCDMIMLGTNFNDVFDPSGNYDENGYDRLNGITDPHMAELAVNMRMTQPGDAPEYCRRWLAYQEYRATIEPEIPLYSDAYMDFHIVALQNYEPGRTGSWAVALTEAILSDYVAEEEEEAGEEEFEFE